MKKVILVCGLLTTTAIAISAVSNIGHFKCPISEGDKVYNSATEKRGTVRYLNPENCRIGIMYNDNTVSQQFSENGGVSYSIDPWTVNKIK